MPARTRIDLVDRESTPNTISYAPNSEDANGVVTFINSTGIPIGDNKLTVSTKRSGGKTKVRFVLTVPTVVQETVNGVSRSKVDRTDYATIEFTFDNRSTVQDRANMVGQAFSLLDVGQGFVNPILADLEGIW